MSNPQAPIGPVMNGSDRVITLVASDAKPQPFQGQGSGLGSPYSQGVTEAPEEPALAGVDATSDGVTFMRDEADLITRLSARGQSYV